MGSLYWGVLNRRIFQNETSPFNLLVNDVKQLIWDWSLVDVDAREIKIEDLMFEWEKTLANPLCSALKLVAFSFF